MGSMARAKTLVWVIPPASRGLQLAPASGQTGGQDGYGGSPWARSAFACGNRQLSLARGTARFGRLVASGHFSFVRGTIQFAAQELEAAIGGLNNELASDPIWAAAASFTDVPEWEYRVGTSNGMSDFDEYSLPDARRGDTTEAVRQSHAAVAAIKRAAGYAHIAARRSSELRLEQDRRGCRFWQFVLDELEVVVDPGLDVVEVLVVAERALDHVGVGLEAVGLEPVAHPDRRVVVPVGRTSRS